MTITITKYDVATPTTPTATPSSGGDLAATTTYYYRVASFRYESNKYIFSAWTAEFSTTTDVVNKTIDLTWDAMTNATGYFIQRTTTSGSYPSGSQQMLRYYNTAYYAPTAIIQNSFSDTGGIYGLWNGYNMDLSEGTALISVSSDADDAVTMANIYDADLAGGWGIVNMLAFAGLASGDSTAVKQTAPYWIKGSLMIEDCRFTFPTMLYTFMGVTYVYNSVTVTADKNNLFQSSPYYLYIMNNDFSGKLGRACTSHLGGTEESTITQMIRRPLWYMTSGAVYGAGVYDNGVKGGTFTKCINGMGSGNQLPLGEAVAYNDCIWEGVRVNYTGLIDATLWSGSPSFRWVGGTKVDGLRTTFGCTYDLEMGASTRSVKIIDPVFEAKTLSDYTNPFIALIWSTTADGRGWSIACNLDLTVIDNSGSAISGATITILDNLGNNALWENSGATSTSEYTFTSTDFILDDTSMLSVGQYVRFELNSEILKITAVSDGTHFTADRAQLGTTAESYSRANKLFAQVASLTTDAGGKASPEMPLISRFMVMNYSAGNKVGYENDHVANGYLTRNWHTPHTITITKAGLKTEVVTLTMDRARSQVIAMEGYTPTLALVAGDIVENAIAGDIVEDVIAGDVTEDVIAGDVTEDAVTGAVIEDAISGDVED